MRKNTIKKSKFIRIFIGLLTFFVLQVFFCFSNSANAASGINEQLNYQGRLFDSTGAVVADGDYNIRFKIYQDGNGCESGGSSPCSGTLKWTETRTGTDKVTVTDGFFSVRLGSVTAFSTSVDWNQDTLWLSVDIGGTGSPSWDGEMTPFRRLTAVPYALNAKQLGGLDWDQFIQIAPSAVQTDSSLDAMIFLNKTGASGNILQLQKSGSDVFSIANSGAVVFQNTTDSTTGFQIKDADGGTPVFNVDTTNERVGIGTSSPNQTLTVNGTSRVIGHGAFGLDSDVNDNSLLYPGDTFSMTISVQEEKTDLDVANYDRVESILNHMLLNPSGTADAITTTLNNETWTASGNATNYTGEIIGIDNIVAHQGSGAIASANAQADIVYNVSTGSITDATGVEASIINFNASGSIGTATGVEILTGGFYGAPAPTTSYGISLDINASSDAYGIYIASVSGTTSSYGIYEAGNVNNVIAGYFTSVGTSSETLRIRAIASQTADLLQLQDTSGVALAYFDKDGKLGLGQSSAVDGTITFYNSTNSNTTVLVTGTSTGARVITLPDETGTVCLQSSANCGFTTSANAFIQNGNSFSAGAVLGTNDSNSLSFETNGTTRATFDTSNGLSFPNGIAITSGSATNISITSGTTGSVAFDSGTTGNVNIGNGSNAKTISIGNATGATTLNLTSGTGGIALVTTTTGTLSLTSGTTGAVTLDSGTTGNVNVGTGNNAKTVNVGTGTAGNIINVGTNNTTADTINVGSALDTINLTSGTINIPNPGAQTNGSTVLCINSNQVRIGATATSCDTSSERFKHDIANLTDALGIDAIRLLRPVSYTYNDSGKNALGFVAEEVNQIDSRPVVFDANGDPYALEYDQFTPMLTKALQQVDSKVSDLEAKLNLQSINQAVFSGGIISGDTEFQGNATFDAIASFKGQSVFAGNATFNANVDINGRLQLSSNNTGTAKLLTGETTKHINFVSSFSAPPNVSLTPKDFISGQYRVTNVTVSGFDIELNPAQPNEANFYWQAF